MVSSRLTFCAEYLVRTKQFPRSHSYISAVDVVLVFDI